jgi:glycosyltransferase involved in cell wall biosynthesis
MKVAFNARLLASPTLRGWNRYTINLLAELPALGVELFLYSDQPLHPSHLARLPKDSYQIRIAPPMRYVVWEQYWLPKQCEKDRVDILHCPQNFGLPWSSPCPRVLTLHDAIDQVYYSQHITWQQLNFANIQSQMYHWIARTRAERIITVSEYSKGDLAKHLHIPEDKITVIYEAADARFHEPVSDTERLRIHTLYKLNSPYIFYVGGWEKRKNIPFLVRAFAQANLDGVDLVLAGGQDEQRAALVQLAESLGVSDRLKLLGWVDDADLPALYAEALCFVYPSEYEGFGLQLCEAIAVGCPVLAARATCLPEVLGDGGETFDLDISNLVVKLSRLATDTTARSQLVKQATCRSQIFQWKKTAELTMALYSELIY